MPRIYYVIGDATDPIVKPAMIAHVCNSVGGWGAGFVVSLSKRSKIPENHYRDWYADKVYDGIPFELGQVQDCYYVNDVRVANMIGQEGLRFQGSTPPIRYPALRKALTTVYKIAEEQGRTLHLPRIGCVLAGGSWPVIAGIIKDVMTVDTVVYTLESQKNRWSNHYQPIDEVIRELG